MPDGGFSARIDPASLRIFEAALARYVAATRKSCAAAASRQLKNALIKARAAMPETRREEIPNLADGEKNHCKIVAWRLRQRAGRVTVVSRKGTVKTYRETAVRDADGRVRRRRRDSDTLRYGRFFSAAYARRFAAKITRRRKSHARFSRLLFTRAIQAAETRERDGSAAARAEYVHTYRTPLTSALKPRAPGVAKHQATIERAIAVGLRRAAADMIGYISRSSAAAAKRCGLA